MEQLGNYLAQTLCHDYLQLPIMGKNPDRPPADRIILTILVDSTAPQCDLMLLVLLNTVKGTVAKRQTLGK